MSMSDHFPSNLNSLMQVSLSSYLSICHLSLSATPSVHYISYTIKKRPFFAIVSNIKYIFNVDFVIMGNRIHILFVFKFIPLLLEHILEIFPWEGYHIIWGLSNDLFAKWFKYGWEVWMDFDLICCEYTHFAYVCHKKVS